MKSLKWVVLVLAFLIVPHFWGVYVVREVTSGVGCFITGVLLSEYVKRAWERI